MDLKPAAAVLLVALLAGSWPSSAAVGDSEASAPNVLHVDAPTGRVGYEDNGHALTDVRVSGVLEAVYQSAFAGELRRRGLPFSREVLLPVIYDGTLLPDVFYRVDFVVNDVLIELKAVRGLSGVEESQVLNHLQVKAPARPCS